MSVPASRGLSAALVMLLGATAAARADVTAVEVWADWKSYLENSGYAVTATETATAAGLTVTNLDLTLQAEGEDDDQLSISVPDLVLTNDGGAVDITLPRKMPIRYLGQDAEGAALTARVDLTQSAPRLRASGAPGAITYDYSADEASLVLTGLDHAGQTLPAENARLALTLTAPTSRSVATTDGSHRMDQTMAATRLTYDLAFTDPTEGGQFSMAGTLESVGFSGLSDLPLTPAGSDPAAILAAGMAVDGKFTFAAGQSRLRGSEGGQSFEMTSASSGGALAVRLNPERLRYDLSQTGTELTVSGTDLPLPVTLNMAQAGLVLDMPLSASDQEQPFELGFSLRDFTMSDLLWAMVDPQAVLPRDPATLVLNLAGKARVLADLFDADATAALEAADTDAAQITAVDIRELLVSALGAQLTGTGAFTFDNTDLTTFDGMPAPSGAANLHLAGANALLEKLVSLGVLSEDDAMGASMMMAVLGVPGPTPDTLSSKIEVTPQGHVLANGQRIK